MLAKRLMTLFAALMLVLPFAPVQAQASDRGQVEILAQYYAQYYGVPLELVRRVINRESTFNPAARNGPYYGLMQILPATARTMGFRGEPSQLLDAETNLIYAVKYLRGAWLLSGGSHDRAVQLYAKGYYYEAKAAGLLEETGLRPGPKTIVAPSPQNPATVVPQPTAQPIQIANIETPAQTPQPEPVAVALGFLPPQRPLELIGAPEIQAESEALDAIAEVEAPARPKSEPQEPTIALAMAEPAGKPKPAQPEPLRPSLDLVTSTFDLLDTLDSSAGN